MSNQQGISIVGLIAVLFALQLLWNIEKHTEQSACYDRALTLASVTESGRSSESQAALIEDCD